MAEKHFVVQGAACKCNFGGAPDKLKISANDRDYINDGDGSAKPIASNKDLGQPLEAKTFGNCSITRSSCSPAITQWQSVYEKVTLTNGGKILTEESKAICSVSGSPCISITFHGQTAAVTSTHFDNVEVQTMAALNPMAPKPASGKEIPKVKSISGKIETRRPALEIPSSKVVPMMTARVNEQLKFTVKDYYNTAKADKDKVSWKIYKGHNFEAEAMSFEEVGPELQMNFDAVGSYRVMAYGTDGTDVRCTIDVNVTVNRLKGDIELGAGMGRIVGKDYRVRRGVPVNIAAKYEIEPALAEEKQLVSMQVTDMNGTILAAGEQGEDTITFTPANGAATYKVTISMDGQIITRELTSEGNGVVAIKSNPAAEVVRPGTAMSFQVTEMTYFTQLQEFETTGIKWQLNGKDVGTGQSISLDGEHFTREGNYVVEAYVMKADAWDAKKGAPSSRHQKDDCRFAVKKNEVTAIKVENGGAKWVVGKRYNLEALTLMPYQAAQDGPITWSPAGSHTNKATGIYATHKGKVAVTATLNGKTKSLEAEADTAEITSWYFGDKDGVYKPRAGWNETLKIIINCPAAAGETVSVHILEADRSSFNYIKEIPNCKFDANGELKADLNTNDIKPMLNKLYFEGKEYDVLFAIQSKPNGIQFASMKTVEADGKSFLFPQKQSNQRGSELGKYVYINSEKEVVSVNFIDSTNYPAYKVYKYGEKIKIRVQTRNLAAQDLTLQIWHNGYKQEDKMVMEFQGKPDDKEIWEVELDTNKLKSGNKKIDDGLRSYFALIKEKNGDTFKFPKEVADANTFDPRNVSFYQHIKLSNASADNLNKLTKDIAPTVLGEALEKEENKTGCPRCNEDITPAMLKQVFKQADDATLKSVADTYNKYMREIGMNTCWNKAHFFAQTFVESGPSLHLKSGESFNYYWEDLDGLFPPFRTTIGKEKAQLWGRAVRKPAIPGVTQENEKNIANYAYGPDAAKGKELGNTGANDGWDFRGKGLVQLTGRTAYEYANTYTKKENADIVANPDLVVSDVKIAVLSSMAFWKWKGLQQLANGKMEVKPISTKVGKNVVRPDGTDAYTEKKEAFDKNTSILFKVKQCTYGLVPEGDNNLYKIDVDAFKYELVKKNDASKQYQFDIYIGGKLTATVLKNVNDKKLLPFPDSGPNWGRFGGRDGGDDNYSDPKVAAAALGFFYSLPKNGYTGKLYFNDMSASNQRNLGHKGHVNGDDIDIRYPGSTDEAGEVLWSKAKESYASEEKFVEALENILSIASKWGFNTNYAYKSGIKNTKDAAHSVHQNHFHIGLR